MRISLIIIFILCILLSCKKDYNTLRTGNIKGVVLVYDETYALVADRSDIGVTLTGDSINEGTVTDKYGFCMFQDIPCGKYHLYLQKEGFLPEDPNITFNHLGGVSATIVNVNLYERPAYTIRIDSVRFPYEGQKWFGLYITTIGNRRKINYGFFRSHVFFNDSAYVSVDNYDHHLFLEFYKDISDSTYFGDYLLSSNSNFLDQKPGDETIFICIYPQAPFLGENPGWFDQTPSIIRKEYLGPPSEVFSFKLDDIRK